MAGGWGVGVGGGEVGQGVGMKSACMWHRNIYRVMCSAPDW